MMMNKRRFVIDTNVVVSALLSNQSIARRAFDKASSEGVLLLSIPVAEEFNDVLKREKFAKYITEEERLQFMSKLVTEATLVEITVKVSDCRDPKDNKFLELAVSGHADGIISSDQDLLVLHPFRGIGIFNPGEFVKYQFSSE